MCVKVNTFYMKNGSSKRLTKIKKKIHYSQNEFKMDLYVIFLNNFPLKPQFM